MVCITAKAKKLVLVWGRRALKGGGNTPPAARRYQYTQAFIYIWIYGASTANSTPNDKANDTKRSAQQGSGSGSDSEDSEDWLSESYASRLSRTSHGDGITQSAL